MISTSDLSSLPDIDDLRRLLQSLALLEAIFSSERHGRRFSFNSRWSDGGQRGFMQNFMSDEFYTFFNKHGCFLKGFKHDSAMTPYRCDPPELWPGIFGWLPSEFAACLQEPTFNIAETTFCIWRRYGDVDWQHGPIKFPKVPDPDGSKRLLSRLDGNPKTYCADAIQHYDKPFLTVEMVKPIFEHRRLTDALIAELTQDVERDDEAGLPLGVADFEEDIAEIGYPS